MVGRKPVRTRGKLQFSRYFQELKEGDSVAVIREPAVSSNFPKTLQGLTGVIQKRRGKAYMVKIKNQGKEKKFLIEPIHLKRINNENTTTRVETSIEKK